MIHTSFAPKQLSKLVNLRVRLLPPRLTGLPSEATPSASEGLAPTPTESGERVTANEQISANEIAGARLVRYQNIIFDLDSTLSSIEGIDELGKLRNIGPRIQRLTEEAMSGRLPFGEVFIRRLELIKPSQAELLTVGKLYKRNITPGAAKLISWLRRQKVNVFVVTAGYTDCSYPLTDFLKIPRKNVFANRLIFDAAGDFIGIDKSVPLWRDNGKRQIVAQILSKHPGKTICVGDGISDWEAAQVTDGFIYFGGVIIRPAVAAKAKLILTSRNLYSLKRFLE